MLRSSAFLRLATSSAAAACLLLGCAGTTPAPSVELATQPAPTVQTATATATATTTATVTLGAPRARLLEGAARSAAPARTDADIDVAAITREVESRLGDLQSCYEQRLAAVPDLAGEVLIHWGINTEGGVDEACITNDTIADKVILDCVNKLVASGAYPASKAYPVDVQFPFVFGKG